MSEIDKNCETKEWTPEGYQEVLFTVTTGGKVVFSANCYGFKYPSITLMKQIKDGIGQYIKQNKSDEYVEYLNMKAEKASEEAARKNPYIKPKKIVYRHIYVIFDTQRHVYKIGKASNVEARLKQLKTANSMIEMHSFYNGGHEDEKHLHEYFGEKRISGEWFKLDNTDLDYIRSYFHHSEIPF